MKEIVRREAKTVKSPVERLLKSALNGLREMRQVFESDPRRMDVLGKRSKSPEEAKREMDWARQIPRPPQEF